MVVLFVWSFVLGTEGGGEREASRLEWIHNIFITFVVASFIIHNRSFRSNTTYNRAVLEE